MKYLTDNPPDKKDPTYEDWMSGDSVVMGWLWHSMEPHVSTTVEFCDSSKKIWDSIAESFAHQSMFLRFISCMRKFSVPSSLGNRCLNTIVLLKICGISYYSIGLLLLIWNNKSIIGRNL